MASRGFGSSVSAGGGSIFPGQVGISDGTAAAPGLYYTAEPTTGYYRAGTRSLGYAAGGLPVMLMNGVASAVNYPTAFNAVTSGAVGFAAAGSDTNIPLVLQPKGTGALQAQPPDGTAAGGNARGAYAVDLQTSRSVNTQVASGAQSVVAGGLNNTASQTGAAVLGGNTNVASGAASSIGGGNNNIASNIASAIGGGSTNTVSGQNGVIAGGGLNTVNALQSWCPGGLQSTSRGLVNRGAWAAGQIASLGDAQSGEFVLRRQTTDATPTRLTADNASASTTNTMNLPNFGAYGGIVIVQAKAIGSTDAATWIFNIGAVRGANAAATTLYLGPGSGVAPTGSNGTASAWRLTVAADTTNGGIAFTVTGAAATTINWDERGMTAETFTTS